MVYWRGKDGNALLVGVYIDDLIITGSKEEEVEAFMAEMKSAFQMSDLGLASPSTWALRCIKMTPASPSVKPATPSASLSSAAYPPAVQPQHQWKSG